MFVCCNTVARGYTSSESPTDFTVKRLTDNTSSGYKVPLGIASDPTTVRPTSIKRVRDV